MLVTITKVSHNPSCHTQKSTEGINLEQVRHTKSMQPFTFRYSIIGGVLEISCHWLSNEHRNLVIITKILSFKWSMWDNLSAYQVENFLNFQNTLDF